MTDRSCLAFLSGRQEVRKDRRGEDRPLPAEMNWSGDEGVLRQVESITAVERNHLQ